MKDTLHGMLITLEGIDGSGKSTIARSLANSLDTYSQGIILTKEPGATPLGQLMRTIVQEKKVPVCSEAEFLLFAADRAQHFAQVVLPALAENKIVISDRMADSSLAYQGYGRGLDHTMIATINAWVMQERQPDIAFYIRVCPETALQRRIKRNEALTSFEQEKEEFMQQVYEGFEKIFSHKENGIIINGEQSMQEVLNDIIHEATSWLTLHRQLQKSPI